MDENHHSHELGDQFEERLVRGVLEAATATTVASLRLTAWAASATAERSRRLMEATAAVAAAEAARRPERGGHRPRADANSAKPESEVEQAADSLAQLRRRGDDLLHRSADVQHGDAPHPAYALILDQLAPDEARVLRMLATSGPQPCVDVRTGHPFGVGSRMAGEALSMVGDLAGCHYEDRTRAYLNNLHRLGLVDYSEEPVEPSRYQLLEVQPEVVEATKDAGRAARIVRRSIRLSSFGDDFCRACFSLPGDGG